MQHFALAAFVLFSITAFVHGNVPSAGACGPTSVANVPGCWGQPGCAYVIASNLGPAAACKYNYCNCDGIPVPLLPQTFSGTITIGCAAYTTQPSVSSCPTAAPVVPAPGPSVSSSASPPPSPLTSSSSNPAPPAPLPTGATVATGTISGKTITETYEPTTYTQFSTLTAIITTAILDTQRRPVTVVVGPSGMGWTPYHPVSGVPDVQPPSVLPGAPGGTQTAAKPSANSRVPLPCGGTIVIATLGSSILTETFVPATLSSYASLASTITTTTFNAQSSPVTILIGPGGVEWTPIKLPSGVPEVPPPSVLPVGPNTLANRASSSTSASSTGNQNLPSSTSPTATSTGAQPLGTFSASYASITDAFDKTAQSETTLVVGGVTEHWSKATFADLATITALRTVTTSVVQTNKDGSQFTVSAAVIIVGPGGRWWNGGTGGLGFHGPPCIWPFCPPRGGGDVRGAGSGTSPNDPNSPGSPEKSSDPDNDNNHSSGSSKPSSTEKSRSTSSMKSSSSSSSCGARTIASDCSVLCSTPTGVSTQTCSTTCYSTVTGCSATGTTVTSTTSGAACRRLTGWSKVTDGEDASIHEPLGTVGIAHPGGSTLPAKTTGSVLNRGSTTAPTRATSTSSKVPSTLSSSRTSSTTFAPRCMADGNPRYSPASWCDCGPSSTYPALSAKSGATSANCAYSTLPTSTIKPTGTRPARTDIPGQDGVPGCAAVVSASGTSAYCNCGGTRAPILSPTSTGVLNCRYTIQPTSSYNPAVTPPTSGPPPPPPPHAAAKCNVHVWQGLGPQPTDPEVVIYVKISDASGAVVGSGSDKLKWAQTLSVRSKLGDELKVTPQTGVKSKRGSAEGSLGKRLGVSPVIRPLFEKGPVDFAVGAQSWDTTSSQCSVGAWDNGNANDFFGALIFGDDPFPNRQIDCKFDCRGHNKKRAVAKRFGHRPESGKDSRRDVFARDPSKTVGDVPTAVDEHLFDVRALTDHGAAWQKYAPSGARYYAAWKAKTGPDAVYRCDFEEVFRFDPISHCRPVRNIRKLLEANNYGTEREYYAINAVGTKGNEIAIFSNTISASMGVFLANDNNRGALPSDKNDPMYDKDFPNGRQPVPWQFSTVAWLMWQKTVLKANPAWVEDPSKADYSGIKSFWRRMISNEETISILDDAFKGEDNTITRTWTPEDTNPDTNAFWPLLGSPNGNGIQYFLTDNKVALKGKGIKSISARMVDESDAARYTMWATFD